MLYLIVLKKRKLPKERGLNGRQRTQKHKSNVKRKFLSLDTTLDINEVEGMRVYNSILTGYASYVSSSE